MIYYTYKRVSWVWIIDCVESVDEDTWFVRGGDPLINRKNSVLWAFPAEKISGPQEEHALLSHLGCNEAVANLGDALKLMLEGTITHLCTRALCTDVSRSIWVQRSRKSQGGSKTGNYGSTGRMQTVSLKRAKSRTMSSA